MITKRKKTILFFATITTFVILLFFPVFPSNSQSSVMLAIVILMGLFWILEILPISITSLLPLVLYPIFKIETADNVSINYFNSTIFLFLGGFILSIAIEDSGLHTQIAKKMIKVFGITKYGVLLAFIFSAFAISMFISNTASTLILFPIVLSVANYFKIYLDENQYRNLSKSLLFGIAYSSSIGGTATLIGTPPNLIFHKVYQIYFPNFPQISFASYMFMVFPLALLMVIFLFLLLFVLFLRAVPNKLVEKPIDNILSTDEKLTSSQKFIGLIFLITCLLWIFRINITIGNVQVPGWANLLKLENFIDDGTVAVFSIILLFFASFIGKTKSKPLIEISSLRKVPWEIILLFGGGFALADGFEKSGLSKVIASQISFFIGGHPLVLIFITCVLVVGMTEFSSNTAVASTFLPLIASISVGLGVHPVKMMIPATLSASYAFMLPISTPPNAIIFSSGILSLSEMVRTGVLLNLVGIILVSLYFYWFF
ncbi:MAG: SLC13 family permease [Candidatus Kapaibacteriales bacterium]